MHPDDAVLFAGEINRQCAARTARGKKGIWYEAWAEDDRVIVRNVLSGQTQTLESVAQALAFIHANFG